MAMWGDIQTYSPETTITSELLKISKHLKSLEVVLRANSMSQAGWRANGHPKSSGPNPQNLLP